MEDIKVFLPILGVLLGFLLAWFKEAIQNKAKIKIGVSQPNLYVYSKLGTWGSEQCENFSDADYIKATINLNVFNIGKAPTAIQDVNFFHESDYYKFYDITNIEINGQTAQYSSFDLPIGSIVHLKLDLHIDRDPNNEILFSDDTVYHNPINGKRGVKFGIRLTDIYRKKHKEYFTVDYITPFMENKE
ncbi:hypothetical protein [Bacillus altitudinis]|uniref:hypothetical protein n=1 Tax=Bacillus altitudinis TaxID=293387 RepID=UPI00228312DC|nr:hypothetical protein [Bacillus altitudinis]MCY7437609.1 hypothetical protein [Bacillus altitudinis]MEC0967405.1 hypothetical protein [Bacillus altitudinis]MEC1001339.1 hypothetical protein [Bacillus altitudinis]MEC1142127.1 hypothetical protein [Bacillus altitudinis]